MSILKSLTIVCALALTQVSFAEVTQKIDTVEKSKRFSTMLTQISTENIGRANDLNSSSKIVKAGNLVVKSAIAAEVIGLAALAILTPWNTTAGAAGAEAGSIVINQLAAFGGKVAIGVASVPVGVGLANITAQEVDGNLVSTRLNGQLEVLGTTHTEAPDLILRKRSERADSMSKAELDAYEKATEGKLKGLSKTYIDSSANLQQQMSDLIAANDPEKVSYFGRILNFGSDQLKYGELVQLSALSQAELAKAFRKVNNDLREELLAVRAIIKNRN